MHHQFPPLLPPLLKHQNNPTVWIDKVFLEWLRPFTFYAHKYLVVYFFLNIDKYKTPNATKMDLSPYEI